MKELGSPISNEAYNLITALQSKLEGLDAYSSYAQDGDKELWRKLSEQDMQSVRLLADELERMVQGGRFRMAA